MGKRKKVKRGKKDNDKKYSQPVMEKDTLPSPTLPNEEAGTDSCFVSCSQSDYNVTFTTRGENMIGTIYWKVGKFYDLEDSIPYVCHLPCDHTNCFNVWQLVVVKCGISIFITLFCYISDRNVTFSVLLGNKVYKTSPLLRVEATEHTEGCYSGQFLLSTFERYKDELTQESFSLKCQVMLYISDLTRSEYPHSICSCSNLTKELGTLYEKKVSSDVTLELPDYPSFHTHKCILEARCPGLRKELLRIPDIISALRVPLLDMAEETFKQVLRYIYTGTTRPLSVDTAIALFHFSNVILEFPNLQIKCLYFLMMKLSEENFLKIYSLAVLTNSMHLKTATEAFLLEHKDLMESLNPDDGKDLIAPSFMTKEEFNSIKASLKKLFQSIQNSQAEAVHTMLNSSQNASSDDLVY